MNINNKGILYRSALIFSIAFAWVLNIIGFVSSKTELFSAKRTLRAVRSEKSSKQQIDIQIFKDVCIDKLNFCRSEAINLYNTVLNKRADRCINHLTKNDLISVINKQMLFPHHGFW
ncbi:hypothetical protein DJ568_07315 [Mucilaginibacter hurinus]|uniref:Uncharacterized protein n=1 Tax=Mucilaginibacter hurinus TaxID=2201324 RepID=A0A367GQF0_9SPHI|nr:hypothetical protein DJ568_07315 [Mucilaginibacter hurinus]